MARDKKKQQDEKPTKPVRRNPNSGRTDGVTRKSIRVDKRIVAAGLRRERAIAEVEERGPNFKRARGKGRERIIERAERAKRQIVAISRKAETRKRLRAMSAKERAQARELGRKQFHDRDAKAAQEARQAAAQGRREAFQG